MPKYIKSSIIWLVLGIVSLAIFILFYNHAFPVASIDVKIDRGEAVKRSANFIEQQGFDPGSFDKTIKFHSDYYASGYLQKTQGIKRTNELVGEGIPIWSWRVRWFKELQKEGFLVDVDPSSGEIIYFHHFVLDDEEGLNLGQTEAMAIAKGKVILQDIDLENYELKDSTVKKQRQRTDYKFVWEKKDYKIEEATLRISADIYGDRLGKYRLHLKVPEEFRRYIKGEISFGKMLIMTTDIVMYLLLLLGIFILLFQPKQVKLNLKFWLICGCIIVLLKMLNFFNTMPLLWSSYIDTVSKPVFITTALGEHLSRAISVGLIIFACGLLAALLPRNFVYTNISLYHTIKNRNFYSVAPIFIVGYSLGFIFLGYVTLFYLIGTKFFSIWIPPVTEYSNILAMSLPFLFPLTIAVSAAVKEEVIYRLFAISFLKKYIKVTWLTLLIPALIWGFAHSFYTVFPIYIRGIELTIFGIVIGIVFLKYGVETVIIAHFVINAILAGLPLLRSHNPYFATSGVIVVALAFLPIIIMRVVFKKKRVILLKQS